MRRRSRGLRLALRALWVGDGDGGDGSDSGDGGGAPPADRLTSGRIAGEVRTAADAEAVAAAAAAQLAAFADALAVHGLPDLLWARVTTVAGHLHRTAHVAVAVGGVVQERVERLWRR